MNADLRAASDVAASPAATALDVRHLPSFGFGQRSLMWWGTMGLMLIEGTVFALAIVMYFYLRSHRRALADAHAAARLAVGHAQHRDPAREPLAEPAREARGRAGRSAQGVEVWLVVCLAFAVRVPGRARVSSSARST